MSSVTPMIQLSSRGLRKAPVKKIRHMCTAMEPTKTSAAQWCIWRMTRPLRTAKDRLTVDAKAADTLAPRSGSVGAVVDDVLGRGDEVEAQEDARGDQHHEGVEGDLAQEERPVVGEDLVEQACARPWPPRGARRASARRPTTGSGLVPSCRAGPGRAPAGRDVTALMTAPRSPGPTGWS